MIKKVSATLALLALSATIVTGCSSDKLKTEATCDYINEQVIEKQLLERSDQMSEDIIDGNTKAYAGIIDEFSSILSDAAEKTNDKKLAKSLLAAADQNTQIAAVMATGTSANVFEIDQKLTALEDQNASEDTDLLSEKCPYMQNFS